MKKLDREEDQTQKQATGDRQQATANGPEREAGTWTPLRRGANIAQRLLVFATGVINLVKTLPFDAPSKHVSMQIIRAATGAGANYEEARAAESASDFIHKLGVANKELREAVWWLELIDEARLTRAKVDSLVREGRELASILAASINTARKNRKP